MGIENTRYAAVNLSSTKIPVYEKLVQSGIHQGAVTAGGNIIGHIYQYEFYIVLPNVSNTVYTPTSYKIYFRDANKQCRYGYIETSPGTTLGYYAWNAQQHPYCYYNSDGSKLVESKKTVPINDKIYRIFTVARDVKYFDPYGNELSTIEAGMEIATLTSETGKNHNDYMVFYWKRDPASVWRPFHKDYSYVFVDLDMKNGNMPNNRAIR